MSTWKTVRSSYVHENPWYKVRRDEVVRPDGEAGEYFVVEDQPAVFIVPESADKKILLVKLHRYPTDRAGWEIPAGSVEESEPPLLAAQRELQEETGYTADSWHNIGSFAIANGMSTGIGETFVARRLVVTDQHEQAEEGITDAAFFSVPEIMELITDNQLVDGPSMTALFKYLVWNKRLQSEVNHG
ncbi:MAG TPA: NUDIX hydrolase [Verrucomicrobiae bacterium]|nr:NUDIX hydrolase [Verrucomicrobiae bacterium]